MSTAGFDIVVELTIDSPPRTCTECQDRQADCYIRDDTFRVNGDYCNRCRGGVVQ